MRASSNIRVEALCAPRSPQDPATNEDRIVLRAPDLFAVVDGATDLSGARFSDGLTGGALAAEAIAEALAEEHSRGSAGRLLTVAGVLETANAAVGNVYRQVGFQEAAADPGKRFRAALSLAVRQDGVWHLATIGDCRIRINGGQVMGMDHPAESVLAQLRLALLALPAFSSDTPQNREQRVRAILSNGLHGGDAPEPDQSAAATVAEDVRKEFESLDAPPELVTMALQRGLTGMRRADDPSDPLHFPVADGFTTATTYCREQHLPAGDVECLELFSDGYVLIPSPAGSVCASLADWEAAAHKVRVEDPERCAEWPAVKPPVGPESHGDDRSVIILQDLG